MPRAGTLMMRARLMRIRLRLRGLQVSDDVFDFGALIVAEAADHVVLAVVAPQRFFNLARLEVGAVENRDAPSADTGAGSSRWRRR